DVGRAVPRYLHGELFPLDGRLGAIILLILMRKIKEKPPVQDLCRQLVGSTVTGSLRQERGLAWQGWRSPQKGSSGLPLPMQPAPAFRPQNNRIRQASAPHYRGRA